MRQVTRLLGAIGALVAFSAPAELSTPARAGRTGGFHGGMGFHGGFRHGGFHHPRIFLPRFGVGFGIGTLYGAYGWPVYYIDNYPYYDYPNDYPYPYPYYSGGYQPAMPYAPSYGGAYQYPIQAFRFTGSLGPPIEPLPPTESTPSASQPIQPDPLSGLARRPPKPASSDNAADPRLPDVRLTGIVIERDRRIAIFAVAGTRPLVLSEGEALKEWHLDSISADMVSLSGPAGTMTLALNSDTNLARSIAPDRATTASPQLPGGGPVATPPPSDR